jgi:hypothetical protein
MADKAGGQGSEGTGGNGGAGGQPAGGQGASAGGQGGGEGQSAGAAGGTGKPIALSPDILPEELRGRSEAETKFILKNMVTSLRTQAKQIEELKGGKGAAGGTGKPAPKEEAPKDEKPAKPYEERILEDPEGTIAEIVEKRFGGVISELGNRTSRSELAAARAEIDDFPEYEEEVLDMLKEAGQPQTFENLAGAYTFVVGQRAIQERRQSRQQQLGMESGQASNGDEGSKKVKLSDLEREIAQAQGLSDEEYAKYRDEDVTTMIRVPTGRKEK